MNQYLKIFLRVSLFLLLFGGAVYSETVYICNGEGEGGSVLFSDKPCKSGSGQSLQFPDTYSQGEGLSELEREQLEEIRARENGKSRETVKLAPPEAVPDDKPPSRAASDSEFDRAACQKAEEDLKKWNKIMSLGYLPEQQEAMETEQQKRILKYQKTCAGRQ